MGPSTNRWLSVLLLCVIPAAGVGIGVGVDRLWLRPGVAEKKTQQRGKRARDPEAKAKRLTARFRQKLDLDAKQTAAVEDVLRRMFDRIRALRQAHRARMRTARDTHRAEIKKALTPAQRAKFEQMVQAYEKRRAERRKRRRGRR